MVRWFIAAYIVIVLVISAKATAKTGLDSNPTVEKFKYPMESSKLHVQDPLPNNNGEGSSQISLDSFLENSVG
jgi:hypothetical protein